jgi:hypothetical protein
MIFPVIQCLFFRVVLLIKSIASLGNLLPVAGWVAFFRALMRVGVVLAGQGNATLGSVALASIAA